MLRSSLWFYAISGGRDGLSARCRPCISLYGQHQMDAHRLARASQKPITEKCCSRCGEKKPIDRFVKNASTKDGFDGKCKACKRTTAGARNKKRTQLMRINILVAADCKERVCSRCGICKPSESFYKCSQNNIGLESACKQCKK